MSVIIWDRQKIEEIDKFIHYISKTKKGEYLEVMADYYIYKRSKKMPMEDYNMVFSDPAEAENVNDGQIKLAFICQNIFEFSKNKINLNDNNIYPFIGKMIRYSISKFLKKMENKERKITFNEYHLLHILKENFRGVFRDAPNFRDAPIFNKGDSNIKGASNVKIASNFKGDSDIKDVSNFKDNFKGDSNFKGVSDSNLTQLIIFNIDLCRELMKIEKRKFNLFLEQSCVLAYVEELDISFLKKQDRKEFFDLLDLYNCPNNKTFFIRLLLVMIYESLKIGLDVNIKMKRVSRKIFPCKNETDFINMFSSPLADLLIFLSSQKISTRAINREIVV